MMSVILTFLSIANLIKNQYRFRRTCNVRIQPPLDIFKTFGIIILDKIHGAYGKLWISIYDIVLNEARHGRALEGLLKRYFK